ncbi:hypothetical protein K439DRAFT_1364705, partial [Ramaria rubella]
DLKNALAFIEAVKNASLDNGDLSPDVLTWLHELPEYVFEVDDPSELYSLKIYTALLQYSVQTYTDVHDVHDESFPDFPMLSHAQMKTRIAQWSRIHPIVNDMCCKSCMAYMGPFSQLKQCLYCSMSHWDEKLSSPKTKKVAQQFYTIQVGPYLQALYWDPKSTKQMHYCHTQTEKLLWSLDYCFTQTD